MRALSTVRRILAAALAAAVAGCALNPPPTTRANCRRRRCRNGRAGGVEGRRRRAAPVADRWLATFDDPALSALVDEALVYNADLQVAAARVEQAAGYVKVAGASLLPSVGVFATGGGKSGGGGGLDGVFLNASLELDVWGRLRYGSAAAEAQSAAVAADYAYARQSLAAMVAKSWFVAIEAGLQRAIAQDALRSSEALLRLAQERLRVGNGDEQAVAEARANVGSYRDTLRQIEQAREQALRALELLLGRYPAAEIAVARATGADAAAGARRHAVATARAPSGRDRRRAPRRRGVRPRRRSEGGAVAAHQPDRRRQQRVERPVRAEGHSNPVWSFGGNLFAPLYQGGALRAQVEIRTAEQKQAVAEYARTAQRAFGESRTRWPPRSRCASARPFSAATILDNERALELAQIQYRVGNVDLRAVEQRQLALYVGAHALTARAERAARAAREPVPRAGRRIRPAGDGPGGGPVKQGRAKGQFRRLTVRPCGRRTIQCNDSMEMKMAKKNPDKEGVNARAKEGQG